MPLPVPKVPTPGELGTKNLDREDICKVAVYKLFPETYCARLALAVNSQAFSSIRKTDSFLKRLSGKVLQPRIAPGDSFAIPEPLWKEAQMNLMMLKKIAGFVAIVVGFAALEYAVADYWLFNTAYPDQFGKVSYGLCVVYCFGLWLVFGRNKST